MYRSKSEHAAFMRQRNQNTTVFRRNEAIRRTFANLSQVILYRRKQKAFSVFAPLGNETEFDVLRLLIELGWGNTARYHIPFDWRSRLGPDMPNAKRQSAISQGMRLKWEQRRIQTQST